MNISTIRNFSIIAHIDHGKSTLADRLLEYTGALTARGKCRVKFLDEMDLERERGITIKAQAVTLSYRADDGVTYILNLIDTPGHVDFRYEVCRSLAACEGAIWWWTLPRASRPRPLPTCIWLLDNDLEVFPVLNKMDLPAAEPERGQDSEIEEQSSVSMRTMLFWQAQRKGSAPREILEEIVRKIPPPVGDPNAPLKALLLRLLVSTSTSGVIILVLDLSTAP